MPCDRCYEVTSIPTSIKLTLVLMNARAGVTAGFPTSSTSPHKPRGIADVSVRSAKILSLDEKCRRNNLNPLTEIPCSSLNIHIMQK